MPLPCATCLSASFPLPSLCPCLEQCDSSPRKLTAHAPPPNPVCQALSRAFGDAYLKGNDQFEGVSYYASDTYASGFGALWEGALGCGCRPAAAAQPPPGPRRFEHRCTLACPTDLALSMFAEP